LVILFFRDHGNTLASNVLKTSVNVADDVLGGCSLKEFAKKRLPVDVKNARRKV